MRVGLDTSVVLRLLTGAPERLAALALERVEAHLERGDTVLVSDLVAAEAYFALQHHFDLSKAAALAALGALFEDRRISGSGAARAVLRLPALARAEPGFVDRLIHAGYRESADRMLTFERAAARLERVEVPAR
jgi:predicted nucleic-acid-binding protein